jgi:hypothetical protein
MLLFTGSKLGGKLSAALQLVQVGVSHAQMKKQVPSLIPEVWNALL